MTFLLGTHVGPNFQKMIAFKQVVKYNVFNSQFSKYTQYFHRASLLDRNEHYFFKFQDIGGKKCHMVRQLNGKKTTQLTRK